MHSITAEKLRRIREYLKRGKYTSMVLMRKDNFSWLTTGGNHTVIFPDCQGMGALIITPERVYLAAQVMDGARIMDEDMGALETEYVPLRWYERSVAETAMALAGDNPVSDVPGIGCFKLAEIYELHNPFFDPELDRMRKLGKIADDTMTSIALRIRPGMTDFEVQAMMLEAFAAQGIGCDVALVGADERAFKYRHPAPCGKRIDRYVLFSPALNDHGLHCNIARSVYFGASLPEAIARPHDAVSRVAANCFSMLDTGTRYADILEAHKAILSATGYGDEWRGHYPGGRTGYYICQADLSLDAANAVRDTDAFEWFITVPGAKTADLVVKQGDSVEVASNTGRWPSRIYTAANGRSFSIPEVMLR